MMEVHRNTGVVPSPADPGGEVAMSIRTGQLGQPEDLPAPEEFELILNDQPLVPLPHELTLEADPADVLDQLRAIDDLDDPDPADDDRQ